MNTTDTQKEYERLRAMLNPVIRGPVTDAILYALAEKAGAYLINNVTAVHDQLYISTAVERYLDQRLADFNIVRPAAVGLGDDIFRQIGIEVINKKQIRELINSLLQTMFGDDAVRATTNSGALEPYNLQNNDTLILSFDGAPSVTVVFTTDQFTNINAATAQEVADAITRGLRRQGANGNAFVRDDGSGPFVVIGSTTIGPSSTVRVLGGRAQNELLFPASRSTSASATTQWTIAIQPSGAVRFTWTGGADPSLGFVNIGNYVNIYATAFSPSNRGTFTVTDAQGGGAGVAYFEIENPLAVNEIVVQGINKGVLFFDALRASLNGKFRYAAAYQAQQNLLEVFIPATTKVVRRSKKGAAHIHEGPNFISETYDPGKNEIFNVTVPAPGAISDGEHFLIDTPDVNYYVYFDTTGSNLNDPAVLGRTGVRVDISSATTASDVASLLANKLTGTGEISSYANLSSVTVCLLKVGNVPDAVNVDLPAPFAITVTQQGEDVQQTTTLTPNPDYNTTNNEGPYIYDLSQPFTVTDKQTATVGIVNPATSKILPVSNASSFPDEPGFFVLGYGTSHQEGPIPYLSRPSPTTLLLSPSYRIQKTHPSGTDVALVENNPVVVSRVGDDFPAYLTDVVAGRIYSEELINLVAATGIKVVITILYPDDIGLSKWGTKNSDKEYIWGP
jgi:hypothetical protein